MFNSVIAKQFAKATYLNKILTSNAANARQFSVAFNVKSRFQDAYEAKMASS
jgi:hypothetical protein